MSTTGENDVSQCHCFAPNRSIVKCYVTCFLLLLRDHLNNFSNETPDLNDDFYPDIHLLPNYIYYLVEYALNVVICYPQTDI